MPGTYSVKERFSLAHRFRNFSPCLADSKVVTARWKICPRRRARRKEFQKEK